MKSLQDTYAPNNRCFGCGPANEKGLRIKSFAEGDELVCDWTPEPHHQAFPNALNGGICGSLLDCHSNWAAAYSLPQEVGRERASEHGDGGFPRPIAKAHADGCAVAPARESRRVGRRPRDRGSEHRIARHRDGDLPRHVRRRPRGTSRFPPLVTRPIG